MICPECGGETLVYDSRRSLDSIRRRRKCMICEGRFTTVEIDVDLYRKLIDASEKPVKQLREDLRKIADEAAEQIRKRILGS